LYGKLRPNLNKVYLAKESGICSTDILVFRLKNNFLAKFYSYYFLSSSFNDEVLKNVGGSQLPRTSWGKMSNIKIPIILEEVAQKQIAQKIQKLEDKIKIAKEVIESASARKEMILREYL